MKVETAAQQLFFCTSLIETGSVAGMGFVWGAASASEHVLTLVTNKHVVSESGTGSFSIAAGDATTPKLGERVNFAPHDFASLWTGHPNPDVDLAAAFLGPFVNSAAAAGRSVFLRAVAESLCPTEVQVENDLDAIEPVVFVGYPNALFDQASLTPIARRGHTATPIALDYNGLPSFLIDASVFPGISGSPVFIHQENSYRDAGRLRIGASRVLFVGVVASVHIPKRHRHADHGFWSTCPGQPAHGPRRRLQLASRARDRPEAVCCPRASLWGEAPTDGNPA